tara:strand:+ start:635 stop:739 length:105 start_codon:yes stop_codon:yes gene_type:complete
MLAEFCEVLVVALDDSAGWLFQMGMITVVIGGHS